MSINGMMRTSVSGMQAQSERLGAVSANIANASTVGYKSANTQFSSLLLDAAGSSDPGGGVETWTRYAISSQGTLANTSSQFDLAIGGQGFMLVSDSNGKVSLTRAGAFVPDGDGSLVNSAGFKLLGLPVSGNGNTSSIVVNGTAGLVPVTISSSRLEAVATTEGTLVTNLPADGIEVAGGDLPSDNVSNSVSTAKSSIVVYGNLGEEKTLDIYYARTTTAGEWEVTVFDAADRDPAGTFPYANGPISQETLVFDANGQLDPSSVSSLSIPVTGGATVELDLAGTSQLEGKFSVRDIKTNGNPADGGGALEIASDGVVYEKFDNGSRRAVWIIPLATVTSPDRLLPKSGNVFETTGDSGDLRVGMAGTSGLGKINSGALENSTVDMASELTDMIEAQRNYTANSKVFQTGSELMDVLVNLKR